MLEFFSTKGFREYVKEAKKILDGNWTGAYTRPSAALYPHQWNWDSGFIAIGYAHYHEDRAMEEIRSLFSRQWENGMVPQIIFNPGALGNYFPEPDFWQVPGPGLTSGITMPPIHATACLHIYEHARNRRKALGFLKQVYPALVSSHRYLYANRDPHKTGLVYIRHPWESGLDNSPGWDGPLKNIPINGIRLPRYQRKDLAHGVPPEQRPTDADYDRYVYLVDVFRRNRYNEREIYRQCPFLVQDVLFNSILCRADRDLVEIGRIIGRDVGEVEEWLSATSAAIRDRMWSSERGQFDPVDLITGELIPAATAASFMPLFASAASREQAQLLYQRLNSVSFCALHQGNCFTVPNYDMSRSEFDSTNYWRGPVWLNINWMLSQGLKNYGYTEKADAMKKDMIQLPVRFGFHEYFDSITGKGYGSDRFSWTSSLFIDLVYDYYDEDRQALDWLGRRKSRRLRETRILNDGPAPAPGPTQDLAPGLMSAIGRLRARFYSTHRGRVDYGAMKRSDEYRSYLESAARLRHFDLAGLQTREERLAFWINLYNTIVVQGIVELGIRSSVREVSDFFSRIAYDIGGFTFTPDDMEHGILRSNARPPHRAFPLFSRRDPRNSFMVEPMDRRIHFALVCGSRSCAPIGFYDSATIDQQLETATRNFVNSSEVVILPEKNKILLSEIFNWYRRDFGDNKDILRFLGIYLDRDEKAEYLEENMDTIRVEYLFYDWNLNH